MKKILACTSIRSDYDLMSPLYKLLNDDDQIDLKLLVSGAHLSIHHGYTINQILEDGLDILIKIETLLSSDSQVSRIKSASILLQNCIETISQYDPDLIIYAGDREDVLVYAMVGGYLGIPTIHFYSGDHVSDGYIDNPVRHATSKLSTAHFVTLEEHKTRLMRMGEAEERISVIGNIALDRFVSFEPLSLEDISSKLDGSNLKNDFALVIFHPITSEIPIADEIFENILKSLEEKNIVGVVSYPNVDFGNQKIITVIEKYKNNPNFIFYKNLTRELFLSIYKRSKFIIGNSSSGICEAASIPIPAINVGMRQVGRYADSNVVFCDSSYLGIKRAIQEVCENSFSSNLQELINSYGKGNSADQAYQLIKNKDFSRLLAKYEDPLDGGCL